jgi:hypothetical protein
MKLHRSVGGQPLHDRSPWACIEKSAAKPIGELEITNARHAARKIGRAVRLKCPERERDEVSQASLNGDLMTVPLTPEQLKVLHLARDGRLNGWKTVHPAIQKELELLEKSYLIVSVDGGFILTERGARYLQSPSPK